MSIAIIFSNRDAQPWADALQAKLPSAKIEVYPDIADPREVEFILCWKPEKEVVRQFPNLRVIQSAGAGADHILNTQTPDEAVSVTRIVDDSLTGDMWEHLLACVLARMKNFRLYAAQQQQQQWKGHAYHSIKDTTISILGLGSIGSFVAQQFAELGFQVRGWSASSKTLPKVQSYAGAETLPAFMQDTDILINLLPLTAATDSLIDLRFLRQLPKGAYLINVGRGEHLVEEDLTAALEEGQLSGAMLDVFRTEPLPATHPFWKNPRITITPHIASLTNIAAVAGQIADNYNRLLAGEPLINLVSKDKGY